MTRIRLYRSHDGRVFHIDHSLLRFRDKANFYDSIASEADIPVDDIICMTQAGQQLNDELLEQLQEDQQYLSTSSQKAQSIHEFYLFNRRYLYTDLSSVEQELEDEAVLEPPVEEPGFTSPPTPKTLESILQWGARLMSNMTQHMSLSEACAQEISVINSGTSIALANLLSHADMVRTGEEALRVSSSKELSRMQHLLGGHDASLRTLSFVQINPKLLPVSADTGKGRVKERTLADYVSPSKMNAVYTACTEVFKELESCLTNMKQACSQLTEDTRGLQLEVQSTSTVPSQETLQENVQALSRAETLCQFLVDTCSPDDHGWPATEKLAQNSELFGLVEDAIGELILLDEVCRESLRRLVADKNDMISRSLHLLSDISSLQSEYADLGIGLSQLDSDFKSSRTDGFRHLSRLHNMLGAYSLTLVEIYRRKEFEDRFLIYSQSLAEVMANFSESERKRRNEFRSQVQGALPWEVKVLDDTTPNLEISTGHNAMRNATVSIDRDDIDALIATLEYAEEQLHPYGQSAVALEVKASVTEALVRLEDLEAEFHHLVEVGLLNQVDDSESEASQKLRTKAYGHSGEKERMEKELFDAKLEYGERERKAAQAHDNKMAALHSELKKANSDLRACEHSLEQEKGRHETTSRALESLQADADTERNRRLNMQEELNKLKKELESVRRLEKKAKAETAEGNDKVNELEAHLQDLRTELEEVREAKEDACDRVDKLMSEESSVEQELVHAQERINELTHQLATIRGEMRDAHEALTDAETARDKLLRNYRAEADGDRAILEENLRNKEIAVQDINQALRKREAEVSELLDTIKNTQSQLTAADEAHEELIRQLENVKEASMEADMARRQSERSLEGLLDNTRTLVLALLNFSDHLKRVSLPASKNGSKNATTELPVSLSDDTNTQRILENLRSAETSDSRDLIIEALAWLTRSQPTEVAVAKFDSLMTLCKKWMKAYRHVNDKTQKQQLLLREKITFRNFTTGDLALFLPTRSSPSITQATDEPTPFAKPWAAFNINYPHYFLKFSGRPENVKLQESLRTKEWIVARIVKIESHIATYENIESQRENNGNPFQLPEGVKYYLLEVENWNLPTSTVGPGLPRRKSMGGKTANKDLHEIEISKEAPSMTKSRDEPKAEHAETNINEVAEQKENAPTISLDETLAGITMESGPSSYNDQMHDLDEARNPSSLSISLRRRSSTPETRTEQKEVDNDEVTTQNVSQEEAARWPDVIDFRSSNKTSASTGGSFGSSIVGSENALRLIDKSTPAFGRGKRANPVRSTRTSQVDSMPNGTSSNAKDDVKGNIIENSAPIAFTSRALGKSRAADEPLNPFSSSPTPFELISRGSLPNKEKQMSSQDKQDTKEGRRDIHWNSPPSQLRSSHDSQSSITSRRSGNTLKPHNSPFHSPRIRIQSTIAPSISKESVQGVHSMGRNASTSSTAFSSPPSTSEASHAGSSGFSVTDNHTSSTLQRSPSHHLNSPTPRYSLFSSQWPSMSRRHGKSQAATLPFDSHEGKGHEHKIPSPPPANDAKKTLRRIANAHR